MTQDRGFQKSCFWLGEPGEEAFAWLYQPETPTATAIVLCPPVGHEYIHTHRSYRYLSEALAQKGVTVLRLDLYGTGDSAGTLLEANLWAHWQANIVAAVHYLSGMATVQQVGLFGMRIGASLAMLTADSVQANFVVVWNPVLKGKRYVRELKVVSRMAPADSVAVADFYEAGGFPISQDLEAALENLEPDSFHMNTVNHLAVLVGPENTVQVDTIIDTLAAQGQLTRLPAHGYSDMMAEPQFTQVPKQAIAHVVEWVTALPLTGHAVKTSVAVEKTRLLLFHRDYSERACWRNQIFAIECNPQTPPKAVLVLVNSGSVHHVGPNRLYVEISRSLAAEGIVVVRADLANLGDSANKEREDENVTYPQGAVADAQAIIAGLKQAFPQLPLYLGGVCSGAHTSFHTALAGDIGLRGVIIINPLAFYWQPGMSLEIPVGYEVNREATHYETSLKNKESWKKLFTGKVDYFYLMGFVIKWLCKKVHRTYAGIIERLGLVQQTRLASDISRILDQSIQMTFIFSQKDPSYSILLEEGGITVRRLQKKGLIDVHTIVDANHTFSKAHYRAHLIQTLKQVLIRSSP